MNIDALRKTGELQGHHWLAIRWFEESWPRRQSRIAIGRACRNVEASLACGGIDPFVLLHRAIVARETLSHDPKVIGVLRETLNAVYRMRPRIEH